MPLITSSGMERAPVQRTTKRITVPALAVWTAVVGVVVSWHFVAAQLPMLAKRPFATAAVLVMAGGAAWVQSLMRTVPLSDALPSRSNGPFTNVVYAVNVPIGLMAIWGLFYLSGYLGPERAILTELALTNLIAFVLVQCVIIAIPIKSSDG
jgi:hypothetical protein